MGGHGGVEEREGWSRVECVHSCGDGVGETEEECVVCKGNP